MPRRKIEIDDAWRMLHHRGDLFERGISDRALKRMLEQGELHRVRRGWYVTKPEWDGLWVEGRHLLHIIAVHRDAVGEAPVFFGASAAVLLGLPLYRVSLARVHTALPGNRHARSARDVLRHEADVPESDVIVVNGIRCTSLDRTVLDLARMLELPASVACADAALRTPAVSHNRQDDDLAAHWREELGARAGASHARGIRRARWVIAFADGRAQLPGESVSRLQLHRLGFRRVGLQVPVRFADGMEYFIDFDLEEADSWGEFDGVGKYTDPQLRGDRTAEEVVLDEKRREDRVRGVTKRRFARWGSEHIRTSTQLGERLAEFDIRPPGPH